MLVGRSIYRAFVNRIEDGLIMLTAQSSKSGGLISPNRVETYSDLAGTLFLQLRHDHVAVTAESVENICILDRMGTNRCKKTPPRRLKTSLGRQLLKFKDAPLELTSF